MFLWYIVVRNAFFRSTIMSTENIEAALSEIISLLKPTQTIEKTEKSLSAGPLEIMLSARSVTVNGEPVGLTSGEYDILMALVRAGGSILTREQLKEKLRLKGQITRIIDVHIASIRKKLGVKDIIKTVYAHGYRIIF